MALTLSPSNPSSRALTPSSTPIAANTPTTQAPRSKLSITDLLGTSSSSSRHTTESSHHAQHNNDPAPTRSAARAAAAATAAAALTSNASDVDVDVDDSAVNPIEPLEDTPDTASTKQPARKSRVLRRKTDHSVIERRRREKINERLIRLQEMVPACRDEVMEMLDKKTLKRGGAKGKGATLTDQEERKAEMERKCSEEMVLEKLCIISHTVDYVTELRSQIAAYRRLCQCDPPVGEPTPRDPTMHHRFAHDLQAGGAEGECAAAATAMTMARSQSPTMTTSSSQSPDIEAAATSAAAPKRKRHWGSNRPPKADPPAPAKKKQRSSAAVPAATKTTRAAARAIAAGANKVNAAGAAESEGEEDDGASDDEGDDDDDYDDEAFEMDDEVGTTLDASRSTMQAAYHHPADAVSSTSMATSPSGKRRFSDPVRLRNGNTSAQQQQQHQQAMLQQRSTLPHSYMRGGAAYPGAMMHYGPMSGPPWHQQQQQQQQARTIQPMPTRSGGAVSSLDASAAATTHGYSDGANVQRGQHAVSNNNNQGQDKQSHQRLQLLATVSAVSQ